MIGVVDAFGGLAGDMFLGALLDAGAAVEPLRDALASLKLEGWAMEVESVTRRQLGATAVRFARSDGGVDTAHRHLPEIVDRIQGSTLHPLAKQRALEAFGALAEAEARVHRVAVDQVHFHETGAADSILDVCGVCEALVQLDVERLWVLPMPGGSGTVQCAHGELPCPVPAVTELLAGWPLRIGEGEGEMITPTAACLLRAWGEPVDVVPTITVERTGYGAGTRESSIARVMLGALREVPRSEQDTIWELRTHVDDMGGDRLAWVVEQLMEAGALDVAVAPILMKKGRPGHAITVMLADDETRLEALTALIFAETTTLGVRRERVRRRTRARSEARVETRFGTVRVKVVGDHARPEYEDCARLAREHGVSLQTIYDEVADARRRDHS
jgi:uncharacterized protein (TIGR00299 family) protein